MLPVREHVHAMAHITGGGLTGNVRIERQVYDPEDLAAQQPSIDTNP